MEGRRPPPDDAARRDPEGQQERRDDDGRMCNVHQGPVPRLPPGKRNQDEAEHIEYKTVVEEFGPMEGHFLAVPAGLSLGLGVAPTPSSNSPFAGAVWPSPSPWTSGHHGP